MILHVYIQINMVNVTKGLSGYPNLRRTSIQGRH